MTTAASLWLREHAAEVATLLEAGGRGTVAFELAERLGHVGHWQVGLADGLVTWSDSVYQILGVTRSDYTPTVETAIDFYHPEDRETVRNALRMAVQDHLPFEFSLRLIRADGRHRYVKSRGLVIHGQSGEPEAIFGVFVDITEQQEANLRLERIANVDVLTGLANRRNFDDALEKEWRRAARERTALSLIMIDIDRFKNFNDLYGHLYGDQCLKSVATALLTIVQRPGDLAARYGGEEFAVILSVTEHKGAMLVARAIRDAVASLSLHHAGNNNCGGIVTISLGVATAYPQADDLGLAWSRLVGEADVRLYEAKRTGRNRVVSSLRFSKHLAVTV
ncbi:sensor domain-containing diguanylate cyclase [Lichenicoccus roseus]|nr:sensor domain-containing diguanylate cyclase [Lichenicoccus roseus]